MGCHDRARDLTVHLPYGQSTPVTSASISIFSSPLPYAVPCHHPSRHREPTHPRLVLPAVGTGGLHGADGRRWRHGALARSPPPSLLPFFLLQQARGGGSGARDPISPPPPLPPAAYQLTPPSRSRRGRPVTTATICGSPGLVQWSGRLCPAVLTAALSRQQTDGRRRDYTTMAAMELERP